MLTTYRLSPPLSPSQRLVTFGAVFANISLAIEGNNVLTAHDTDPRLDVDIETDIRTRFRLLLSWRRWLQNMTEQLLELDSLLRG